MKCHEATRRMEELYNVFGTAEATTTTGPAIDFTRQTILFMMGRAYAVPLELPPDEATQDAPIVAPGGGGASPEGAPPGN